MASEVGSELCHVSVIMPAYRAAGTIGRALASVAAQTLRPREVVVVLDGPDDDARAVVEGMRETLRPSRLIVVEQEHGGAGAARNRAIEEANCTYLAFLDADDEWLPEKLERTMAHFDDDNCVLVSHDVLVDDETDVIRVDCARHYDGRKADQFVDVYRTGFISTSTAVAHRDAVMAAGGFDTGLGNAQDFDLWLALLAAPGARFKVFGEALTRYHVTRGSIMANTGRRLACCLAIARRFVPELKTRRGPVLASLWYRVLAVHAEAFAAYWTRRQWAGLLGTLALLPIRFTWLTLAAMANDPGAPRPHAFHERTPPTAEVEGPAPVLIALWSAFVIGTYLWQFRPMYGQMAQTLGLPWAF